MYAQDGLFGRPRFAGLLRPKNLSLNAPQTGAAPRGLKAPFGRGLPRHTTPTSPVKSTPGACEKFLLNGQKAGLQKLFSGWIGLRPTMDILLRLPLDRYPYESTSGRRGGRPEVLSPGDLRRDMGKHVREE